MNPVDLAAWLYVAGYAVSLTLLALGVCVAVYMWWST